ncbi:MAG: SufE family protein [Actinomycetota bacterium]
MDTLENPQQLISDFANLKDSEKLDLLLEFSEKLPSLPPRYADHPELLERVEECQSPIFLFVEIDQDNRVRLFFSAPEEAPTTRGFASILFSVIDGLNLQQAQDFDIDFPFKLSLAKAVSPLRLRGMVGILSRIKRQLQEKA